MKKNHSSYSSVRAFTLIEVAMAIALMSILAVIAIDMSSDTIIEDQFENTKQEMIAIRNGLIGNPEIKTGTTRASYGYLGDIGALPTAIADLITNPGLAAFAISSSTRIGVGWNGSYLKSGDSGKDYTKDAWGTTYVYTPGANPPTLVSYGADKAVGGAGVNRDITIQIPANEYTATVYGVILNGGVQWSGDAQVEINYPNGSGVNTTALDTVVAADNGAFSFTSIPIGVRSVTIYVPTKASPTLLTHGPVIITVDKNHYLIPTNYTDVTLSTCPSQYVLIPGSVTYGTPDFCVMKFEAKNVAGVATSQAASTPWVSITPLASKTACTNLGPLYDLITNSEWMTMARNVEAVTSNWSGGVVGTGQLNRGHSDNSTTALAVTDTTDPYNGTGNNSGEAVGAGWEQKRTFTLSNNEIIWDIAGNVAEFVDWNLEISFQFIPVANKAYRLSDGAPTSVNLNWTGIDTRVAATDLMRTSSWQALNPIYDTTYGIGRYNARGNVNDGVATRGDLWNGGVSAGIYGLNLWGTGATNTFYGFRCVNRTCPRGYILVPSNAAVGTTSDFCVMQFEAKDVGGVATSQATLTPWASITLATAQTNCTNLGAGYDLISTQEWMTIARNIEAVASNWSGGVVGTGQLNRGHSDNNPASRIAVTDLNDPYSGTGNNSGQAVGAGWEQKRTHTLSNGVTIWDLAGNVTEMSDWDMSIVGLQTIAGANKAYCNPPDVAPVSGNRQFNIVNQNIAVGSTMEPKTWQPTGTGYTTAQGIGNYNSRSGAAAGGGFRGGLWNSTTSSGIYHLSLEAVASSGIFYGFRCVYRP